MIFEVCLGVCAVIVVLVIVALAMEIRPTVKNLTLMGLVLAFIGVVLVLYMMLRPGRRKK